MNFYRQEDHINLSKVVKKLKKRWMVSYDNQDFILNLYKENKKIIYQLSQCASNRIGDEVLIIGNQLNYVQSLNALCTPIII